MSDEAKPKPPVTRPVAPMETAPWADDLTVRLTHRFGAGLEFLIYREQPFLVGSPETVFSVLRYLKLDEQFDYLVDITAVDYPQRVERFDLIYVLYSHPHNRRIRVKTRIADGFQPESVVPIYRTANWLEREVFDMFGIRFSGHPELRRILLPDEWEGHPLRKDYGITQMDNRWVQANLGIESGQ